MVLVIIVGYGPNRRRTKQLCVIQWVQKGHGGVSKYCYILGGGANKDMGFGLVTGLFVFYNMLLQFQSLMLLPCTTIH
jgi:hypothetical protein